MNRRLALAALLGLVGVACATPQGTSTTDSGKGYNIKVIEGCEYIEFDDGFMQTRVYSLTHKGNCKNPIHKLDNSEKADIVIV